MKRLGFSPRWIQLIMMCIRSVSYAVLVNGQSVGCIKPTRGIRQGNPLSPYVFILCAEALSSLLHRAETTGYITGVPTSKREPRLSHLFFVDDSLLFCKANSVEWRRLVRLLDRYETASGQKLNKEKTSIFLAEIQALRSDKRLFSFRASRSHNSMINTLDFHPWWGNLAQRLLKVLKIECGPV